MSTLTTPAPVGTARRVTRPTHVRCVCARHADGSVTTFLCPVHADTDPCLTMSRVTGRRRTGTIRHGVCTSCGHDSRPADTATAVRMVCKSCGAESPAGIGYVSTTAGPLPAPAADCHNPHAEPIQ